MGGVILINTRERRTAFHTYNNKVNKYKGRKDSLPLDHTHNNKVNNYKGRKDSLPLDHTYNNKVNKYKGREGCQ